MLEKLKQKAVKMNFKKAVTVYLLVGTIIIVFSKERLFEKIWGIRLCGRQRNRNGSY